MYADTDNLYPSYFFITFENSVYKKTKLGNYCKDN